MHSPEREAARDGNSLTRRIRGFFARMYEGENFVPRIILISLLAAYFIQNIFVFDNIGSYLMFFFVLGYIHVLYARPWNNKVIEKNRVDNLDFLLLPALLVAFVGVFYVVNAKPLMASQLVIRALSEQSPDGPVHNQKLFEEAIALRTFGTPEIREQFLQAAFNVGAAQTLDVQTRSAFITSARTQAEAQIAEHPLDARAPLFLGAFLARFGQYEQAVTYLEQARTRSPKKQYILSELGAVYVGMKNTAKGAELFKESYELDKNNKDAAVLYGVGVLYNKNIPLAEEIFKNELGDVVYPDERIASAYAAIGQKAKAIAILNKIAELDPSKKERVDQIKASL